MVARWTGHPLPDAGMAALTVLAGRSGPSDLTLDDLERVAGRLKASYTAPGPLQSLMTNTVVFNSKYNRGQPADREAYVQRVLFSWRQPAAVIGTRCAFCGQPAAYRANREDMPLFNGRDVPNFSPRAEPGLPVCGVCSLAIHALPFGCLYVQDGRLNGLLAIVGSTPEATLRFARKAVRRVQILLAAPEPADKFSAVSFAPTQFVQHVVEHLTEWSSDRGPVAGVLFTNFGSSPDIRLYAVASDVVDFIDSALHHVDGTLTAAWHRAVERAWGKPSARSGDRPNLLYRDVLRLPEGSRAFFDRFIKPARHWGLAVLYARKVLHMDKEKLVLTRAVGERIAEYAADRRAFYFKFARENHFATWRRELLRAVDDCKRTSGVTLLTFDDFAALFIAEPGEYNDWRLTRDMITLLMIDRGFDMVEEEPPLFDEEPDPIEEEQ